MLYAILFYIDGDIFGLCNEIKNNTALKFIREESEAYNEVCINSLCVI